MKRPSDRTILCIVALLCVVLIILGDMAGKFGWFGFGEIPQTSPSMIYLSSEETSIRESSQQDVAKININTATAEQLETLPVVGTTLAKRFVEYRQQHGTFRQVEDLLLVSGIGDATLEKISPYITCQ